MQTTKTDGSDSNGVMKETLIDVQAKNKKG
jgi:hypothetical protein